MDQTRLKEVPSESCPGPRGRREEATWHPAQMCPENSAIQRERVKLQAFHGKGTCLNIYIKKESFSKILMSGLLRPHERHFGS